MSVRVVMNTDALMEIANIANREIAEPIAHRVAARAGSDYRVDEWPRTMEKGWARTRVVTDSPAAMAREVKTGALVRALGGA